MIVLSWSKVFSVMLYSNCKLHDFKRKDGCEKVRVEESEKEKERESERKREREREKKEENDRENGHEECGATRARLVLCKKKK